MKLKSNKYYTLNESILYKFINGKDLLMFLNLIKQFIMNSFRKTKDIRKKYFILDFRKKEKFIANYIYMCQSKTQTSTLSI